MKSLSALLLVCLLTACATPKVHLNHRYLNNTQTESITAALQAKGFKVELNQLSFPVRITANTLIYSPLLRDATVIDRLQDVLAANGWHLQDRRLLVESNQWFTRDNLGLFLLPEGVEANSGRTAADLAHSYQAQDCQHAFQLHLHRDGRFDFHSTTPDYPSFTGHWQLAGYPYLWLHQSDPYLSAYYQVERSQLQDMIGSVSLLTLKPMNYSLSLPDCAMSFGLRQ